MSDGDSFVVNHPYFGGSPHATDVALISPIIVDDELFGFTGSIAHKSDIGGLVPGTNSGQAREIFHEGIMIPPVRFTRAFETVREVETILRANSRTPDLVLGDLRGQVGATLLGAERVRTLCRKYAAATVPQAGERLFAQTEQRVRAAVAGWPNGSYTGHAQLHDDAIEGGKAVHIRVRVTIEGDRINFDFRESDDQVTGPFNIRPPLVRAVCYYCLKCLIDPDMPSNAGLAASVDAEFRPGSLVCPEIPAPVNTYMPVAVATAEAVFDALAGAVPRARIAECSSGTNGTLSHARTRRGYPQVQYELPAGAIGARATLDGVSASKAHVANGGLTPIEILETEFPIELLRFELVQDSGGPGRQRGGLGWWSMPVRSRSASSLPVTATSRCSRATRCVSSRPGVAVTGIRTAAHRRKSWKTCARATSASQPRRRCTVWC
jgi:N-methylhydantoinase B